MENNKNIENHEKHFIYPKYTFTEAIPTYQYPYYVQALVAYGKADICIVNSENTAYPYALLCEAGANPNSFHECLYKVKMEELRKRTDFDDIALITYFSTHEELMLYQRFIFECKSKDIRIVYCGDLNGMSWTHALVCNGIKYRGKFRDEISTFREKEIFSKAPFPNPVLSLRFDESEYGKYSRAIALYGKDDFYIADCGIQGNFSLYRYALLKREGANYSELSKFFD